ncbi:MAG: DUF2087 domain-containing protein [Rubrivivax sp.]|nr:DUF2087 domain-containing protein [Rubrivivax sp.]
MDEDAAEPATPEPVPKALRELAMLVVKEGVGVGGLPQAQRALALAFVWTGLPAGALSEREVNEALKSALAGAARFLDTDHVELRRWLVDSGWLCRDGFGREYRRVDAAALPAPSRGLAGQLEKLDAAAFADRARDRRDAERSARRRAWADRAGPPADAA